MQFLKKHYEKIILMVVLAGLLGAAGWLLWQVKSVQEQVGDAGNEAPTTIAAKEPVERYTNLIYRIKSPSGLSLAIIHPVFNPWTWYLKTNATGEQQLIRSTNIGPARLQILKVNPLNWILDAKATVASDRTNFTLSFTREDDPNPNLRKPRPRSAGLNQTAKGDDSFQAILREGRNLNGNMSEFVVDIMVTNEPPVMGYIVTPGNPWKKVMNYSVDMIYPPEPVPAIPKDRRVGDKVNIDGEIYKIIAIKETELTLESQSQKRTTIQISLPRP